jgi:hypothetical protein
MPTPSNDGMHDVSDDIMKRTPKLLDGLNYKSKGENIGKRKSWGVFLAS